YGEDALQDQIGGLNATIESGNPFVYVPVVDSTTDALGLPLADSGRVKYNANLVQSACATFDGTDDYGLSPDVSSIDLLSELTYSVWLKIDALQVMGVVATKTDASTGHRRELDVFSDGKPYLYSGSDTTKANTALTVGKWHHVAVTFVNATGEVKIYIDGVLDRTGTWVNHQGTQTVGEIKVSSTWYSAGASAPLLGSMCDLAIYNRALSEAEVVSIYNNGVSSVTANLVAWYPMAEGAGSTLYDVSGNNLHVTMYNTTDASFWSGMQDVFHYNIDKGFSLYQHATNNDLRVPYDLNGQPLSITPPSGYTLASEHPAGNWHNNAETKIQMIAGDANLAAGTFWMDSAGTLQARSYNDIVGIWNNEN
ncbi:MAG: LamG domain-containing protein, partial [Chloroflexi bacterium]